ncbi:hypothetical protein GA0115254_131595 [Streptomyces sp. Ncost-T10-10d]|nr:hypothetical protein GA0115254_131595 [Streptomyces sp. Ncost-T10-10d]
MDISGAVAEDLAPYREKFRRHLPQSLDELHGPTQGVVELPLHMAWSGLTSYDMSKPRQRMGLYRTVLHEGLRGDLPHYLNRDPLLQMWPVLRTLVGRTVCVAWEGAFPLERTSTKIGDTVRVTHEKETANLRARLDAAALFLDRNDSRSEPDGDGLAPGAQSRSQGGAVGFQTAGAQFVAGVGEEAPGSGFGLRPGLEGRVDLGEHL